ncbi:MAG TPA: nucleotide disphospho-sugar-binding domain-containing protein [Mycobacteriales bacterium]
MRALVAAGDSVTLTTGPAFEPAVTAAGARFVELPADAVVDAATPPRRDLSGPRLIRHDLVHLFTAPAATQAHHVLDLLRQRPADVLVADTGFVGASLAAERSGIPLGVYGITVFPYASRDVAPFGSALPPRADLLGRTRNRVLGALLRRFVAGPSVAALDEQRRRVGLPRAGRSVLDWNDRTALYLQLSPPGYDYPRSDRPAVVHDIGMPEPPVPAAWTPPTWWPALQDRRVVVVTQGTVATDPGQLLRPALDGLAGLDVLVVALAADPAALGPLPANARAATFVPYGPLMRRAAAVVTNGGFGGVQLALAAGVPLVVAGRTEDKGEVAARVAWSGVGLDLRSQRPAPAAVATAVRQVLATPAFGRRARELATRAPSAQAPGRAVALLEQLARTGAPVTDLGDGPVGGVGRRP